MKEQRRLLWVKFRSGNGGRERAESIIRGIYEEDSLLNIYVTICRFLSLTTLVQDAS